jgi:hypothetical protein
MELGKRKIEKLYNSSSDSSQENDSTYDALFAEIDNPVRETAGTLKDLKQFVAQGVVRLGQQCSVQRNIARHTIGLICYTVVQLPENDEIILQPEGETIPLKGQPILEEVYRHWFPETQFYTSIPPEERKAAKFTGHLYKTVRFHYRMRKHPSCVNKVAISDLKYIQKSIDEWEPIMSVPSLPIPSTITSTSTSTSTTSSNNTESESTTSDFGVRIVNFGETGGSNPIVLEPNQPWNLTRKHFGFYQFRTNVKIPNRCIYGLELHNNTNDYAAAVVIIDSKFQGEFVLEPLQKVVLQRPSHDTRRFLFYCTESASRSQIMVCFSPRCSTPDNNLIMRQDCTLKMKLFVKPTNGCTVLSVPSNQCIQDHVSLRWNMNFITAFAVTIRAAEKEPPQPLSIAPLTSCPIPEHINKKQCT